MDIAALCLARQKNPSLTVAEFVKGVEPVFKVLVPRMKMNRPAVRELVSFLKDCMQPEPPWER